MIAGVSAQQARTSAARALIATQRPTGWWADFRLAPGFSDEWVTGFVGSVLAETAQEAAIDAARRAWVAMLDRSHTGGTWGYNAFTPGDADSTTWGLALAEALGESDSSRARVAHKGLTAHVRVGGMTTYATDVEIRRFIGASPDRSFDGWCNPHLCVTAATAALSSWTEVLAPSIRERQRADGGWTAYWWSDDAYATALAADALARTGDREAVQKAVRYAVSRVSSDGTVMTDLHPGGSAFDTAWILCVLLLGETPDAQDAADHALTWLIDAQREDGLWESSARLRVPLPEDRHPERFDGWIVGGPIERGITRDQHHLFTTASVLRALQRATER
jgi:hypothetical protein